MYNIHVQCINICGLVRTCICLRLDRDKCIQCRSKTSQISPLGLYCIPCFLTLDAKFKHFRVHVQHEHININQWRFKGWCLILIMSRPDCHYSMFSSHLFCTSCCKHTCLTFINDHCIIYRNRTQLGLCWLFS